MKLCLDTKIERHDAVGLVHRAWLKSFAKVDSNKRAIADRGWNPLSYKLLDHEELHRVKDDTAVKKAYELSAISFVPIPDPSNLNFSTGIARSEKRPWILLRKTRRQSLSKGDRKSSITAQK